MAMVAFSTSVCSFELIVTYFGFISLGSQIDLMTIIAVRCPESSSQRR